MISFFKTSKSPQSILSRFSGTFSLSFNFLLDTFVPNSTQPNQNWHARNRSSFCNFHFDFLVFNLTHVIVLLYRISALLTSQRWINSVSTKLKIRPPPNSVRSSRGGFSFFQTWRYRLSAQRQIKRISRFPRTFFRIGLHILAGTFRGEFLPPIRLKPFHCFNTPYHHSIRGVVALRTTFPSNGERPSQLRDAGVKKKRLTCSSRRVQSVLDSSEPVFATHANYFCYSQTPDSFSAGIWQKSKLSLPITQRLYH